VRLLIGLMEWIWRLIYLNIVWLLFSLPIITIIPATFAMFSIVDKWLSEEEPPLFTTFVSEFKSMFRSSYPLGAAIVIIGSFITMDLLILKGEGSAIWVMVRYALIFLAAFFLIASCYSLTLHRYCRFSWYKTLFVSLMIGLRELHITLFMFCGMLLVILLFLFMTGIGIWVIGSLMALIISLAGRRAIQKI
jgi:uncharacterized membrane protein YesL